MSYLFEGFRGSWKVSQSGAGRRGDSRYVPPSVLALQGACHDHAS